MNFDQNYLVRLKKRKGNFLFEIPKFPNNLKAHMTIFFDVRLMTSSPIIYAQTKVE